MEHTPPLLAKGVKVVDLSAAYRIKDAAVYERAYGHHHTDAAGLERAVYGLTEFAREAVRVRPWSPIRGVTPTAAAAALIPLLRAGLIRSESIVINAASGVSGAGRAPKQNPALPRGERELLGVRHRRAPASAGDRAVAREVGGRPAARAAVRAPTCCRSSGGFWRRSTRSPCRRLLRAARCRRRCGRRTRMNLSSLSAMRPRRCAMCSEPMPCT